MAKQLNVNLAFTADTGKAKAQLQDLQRQLDSLMKKSATKTDGLGLTKDLMKATEAAGELKMMLEAATTPTGKLDLGAFNQAIQKSNRKLSDYADDLNSLGPDGQKAFANIAKAISTAEMPLRRTNNLLSEFAVTLKNTARWQISSSILHGFMGSVQSAYGYAQDLNESLNDIRIVTGQSTDQMAEFAANANKAAKELSTTTTAYTNAALIYYQQGDDDATVLEKTDVTTKMANVTGQEASVVSDQLTAIWNNFNKTGEESYEKYADILTALGAETASSTDEIAGGLEKFASIADMIGLSYEYAATALATITATTRQSEDVVGTALKTIFARIQGLNLGETLDDGTTLNKYSEALEKVGISIFEQNGELKNMDSILDEMGAKWKTLSDDQQVALAQTVAGVRQYNQLVSLMDNWDYFGENLAIAEGAEGELDRQAETYAESWEAARKRVQASAQSIYQTLIDDDFFIGLSNIFADLLSVIKGTIDGLGGLPGVLTLISSLMLQSFGPEIADSINNTFYNLTYNTQTARDELRKLREDAVAAMASLGDDSIAGSASIDVFRKQSELQDTLLTKTHELEKAGKRLSDEEAKRAQQLMDITDHISQQILKATELRQEEESITKTITDRITQESLGKVENLDEKIKNVKNLQTTYTALGPIISSCRDEMDKLGDSATEEQKARMLALVKDAFNRLKESVDITGISFDGLSDESKELLSSLLGFEDIDSFDVLKTKLGDMGDAVEGLGVDAQKAFISLRNELLKVDGVDKQGIKKLLDDLKTSLSTTGRLTAEQIQQFKNFGIAVDETGKIIEGFKGKVLTFADGMVALGQVLSSFASVLLSIKGLSDIWTNEDLTTGEKVLRTLTTLGMILPMLTRLFDAQNLAKLAALKIDKQQIKTTISKIAGIKAETIAEKGLTAALWNKVAAYMAAHWWVLAIIAVMGIAVGVIVAVTNAYNEEAKAAEMAAERAAELKQSYDDAKTAAEELKETISDYSNAILAISKLEKGTLEYKQAIIDANEKAIELLNTHKELAQYAERQENGLIVIKQEGLDDLLEKQLKTLQQRQSAYTQSQIRQIGFEQKSQITNFAREQDIPREVAETLINEIAAYLNKADINDIIPQDLYQLDSFTSLSEDMQTSILENIDSYNKISKEINNTNKAQQTLTQAYIDAAWRLEHPEEEVGDQVELDTAGKSLFSAKQTNYELSPQQQEEARNDYINSRMEEMYDKYVTNNDAPLGVLIAGDMMLNSTKGNNRTNAENYASLMEWDPSLIEFDQGFWEMFTGDGRWIFTDAMGEKISVEFDDLMQLIADKQAELNNILQAEIEAPEFLASTQSFVDQVQGITNNDDVLSKLLLSGTTYNKDGSALSAFTMANTEMSQIQAQDILDNWKAIEDTIAQYDQETGFWTQQGFANAEEYLDALKEWLINRSNISDGQALGMEYINSVQSGIDQSISEMFSGDLTFDNAASNQNYTGLTNQLNELKELFPELTRDVEIFSNTGLIGSETWAQAAHNLQIKINELKLNALIESADDAEKAINKLLENPIDLEATLQTDRFQDALNDLLDKNYAIDVEIHAQAEQAFESFQTAAEQMHTMASKIGEDYVIAASDIRELNNVFPGIIQGMQDVGDGSVKLNEQVVQNAMNSANAEVQASAYSTIEQLENQAALLRSKQTTYMAMYEAALALSKGEGDAEANTQKIKEGMLEIEALNNQEMSDTKQENAEAVATDSNVQAGIMAQNWDSAYQSAAQSAIEFAKVAVSAAKSAQTGELQVVSSDFGVSYQGRNGQSSEAAKLAELQSAVNEASTTDDYAALAQSFLEAAESTGMKANDIEGMIAEIGAEYLDLSDLISDVEDGLGPDPKETKKLEDLAERYHEITREIIAQEHALDKLSEEKDKAFGNDKLKFIDEEIKGYQNLYEEQNKLYLLRLADLALDQQNLQKTFNGKVDFNKDTNEINNFTDLYNSATEEQRKLLEEYEKSLDALRDQEDTLYDIASTLQSLKLEEITVEVESEVEINQRDLDKLDYVIDKLGRNLNTAIEQIDALGQQIGKYDSQSQSYRQGIADIEANAAAQGRALTEDEQQKIQEYKDALLDINGALLDIVETVEAKILEEFDEFNSKIDDNISRFDTYNSMLDHYNNIIKLSGRQTKDSMLMMELSAQKTETSLQKLNATRDKYLAQKSVQDDVASKLAEAQKSGNEADIKYWQEQYDEITKAVEESHNEMLASWEETLEAAGSQFELAIETTIQTLKDSISEFGLDNLADRYSKGQEEQERYLSNLDKEYELNKLNREISGKIDDTDNIRAKQKLLELQDEINKKLASGEEMSRYDLEHLQKKYELELAKIALEEAQNAKSTVRLTKDSEGNFGYVYTADQDSIDNAQQNYEDKLYELKKSSEDYLDEMSEKIIQNQQEMMEALAEVDRTKFETQEEYEDELDRIKEYYMGRDKYYRGEMQKAMDELGITYQETLLGQLEGSASLEEAQSKLETNTNETVSKMGEAWKEWHDTVGNAMEEAGTSSETFTEDIKSDAEEIGTATEDLADVIDEQTENMVDYMGRLVEAVADWRDQYISAIDEIIKKNEELADVQAVSFDKDADYAALINEYLNNGGEVGDATYKELRKQRDAKIDWLEEQGYDSSYWGTRGSKTDEMYSRIAGGKGTAEENEWFTKDYIDDEKLAEIFNKLEVPLGALEQTVGNINTGTQEIKTATDTVGGKIDATQNYFNATSNAINTKNAEISGTIGDKLDANSQNALNQISTTEGSINQGISDAEKSLAETLSETVSGGKTLSDIDSSISDAIAAISADIDAAKKEIQEDIGSLSRQVNTLGTAAVGGAMGGPAGALIGGLVGGVISAAATMDTGGYTGSWGPEGKMAVLHEKELVLNKNDTSNLLNTLGVMKDIMHMIDVQANMASLSHLNAVSDIKSLNDTLEQNVTIHAEFPNATNRNEIEEAFSNLVNRATQYANRKK